MASILDGIINSLKGFIRELEQMGKDASSEIRSKSDEVASELQVLLRKAFQDIKAKISQMIRYFKAKIDSLSRKQMDTSAGPSASGFSSRLRSMARDVETLVERLLRAAKTDVIAMMSEAREIVHKLADGMRTGAGDVTAFLRKAGQDIYKSLRSIGESAVKETESFATSVLKDVEVDGSFAFKHSLQIAEAAAITVVNPVIIVAFAAAAGIIVIAHNHGETIKAEAGLTSSVKSNKPISLSSHPSPLPLPSGTIATR